MLKLIVLCALLLATFHPSSASGGPPECPGGPVELIGSGIGEGDRYGSSVAVSNGVAVVGANVDTNDQGLSTGSAYVFRYDIDTDTWVEEARLNHNQGAENDSFGRAVAINEAADVIVVGATGHDGAASNAGRAFVFVYDPDQQQWLEHQWLSSDQLGSNDSFGWAVGISGENILVGARFDDDGGTNAGAIYAYRYDSMAEMWIETEKLIADPPDPGQYFGECLAVEGTSAVVGARWTEVDGLSAGAAYVMAFDGLSWAQEAALVPEDGEQHDFFGSAVDLSNDAVLVGAFAHPSDDGVDEAGAAYIFREIDGQWTQEAKLIGSQIVRNRWLGYSVALEDDVAVCGAPKLERAQGTRAGGASVFERIGEHWEEVGDYHPVELTYEDHFGWNVAFDGQTLLGRAYLRDTAGDDVGSIFLFPFGTASPDENVNGVPDVCDLDCNDNGIPDDTDLNEGTSEDTNRNLTPDECDTIPDCILACEPPIIDPLGGGLGQCFGDALDAAGDLLAIGAPDANGREIDSGTVTVMRRQGDEWVYETTLMSSDGAQGDRFGGDVATDGQRIVVGARLNDAVGSACGAAYIYECINGEWNETRIDSDDLAQGDFFGESVAMFGDTVVIGAARESSDDGAAYVFDWKDGQWTQRAKLTADGTFRFGSGVEIAGDTIAVGSLDSVYIFSMVAEQWTHDATIEAPKGTGDFPRFGGALALFGDMLAIGASEDDTLAPRAGAVYVYARSGREWTLEQSLFATDPRGGDWFGWDLAVESDLLLVGTPYDDDGGWKTGSAYLFEQVDGQWVDYAKMHATDLSVSDDFGWSVDLLDGEAIIGARGDRTIGVYAGAVYRRTDLACPNSPDLNGDGVVGPADLALLLDQWGECPTEESCPADLNGDGQVDAADLAALLDSWT